jgi:hypothetical protein
MNDLHILIKRYKSGAFKQPVYPKGALTIESVGKFEVGNGFLDGYSTVSVGQVVVNEGPGWRVTEPLTAFIVKTRPCFTKRDVLDHIPGDAMPLELFFPNELV